MGFRSADEGELVPVEKRRFFHFLVLHRRTRDLLLEADRRTLLVDGLSVNYFRADCGFVLFDVEFWYNYFRFGLDLVDSLDGGGRVGGGVDGAGVLEVAGGVGEGQGGGGFGVSCVIALHLILM